MERAAAIEKLARLDLQRLSLEERRERLELMQLEEGPEAVVDPSGSPRHDDAMLLRRLTQRYAAAANAFLLARLHAEFGTAPAALVGRPLELEACPCCGLKTIGERGNYEICTVCWWEDDGQDTDRADVRFGGPNGSLTLTEARIHFLVHGIFDPTRDDLRRHQDPPAMFEMGRRFEFEGNSVREVLTLP